MAPAKLHSSRAPTVGAPLANASLDTSSPLTHVNTASTGHPPGAVAGEDIRPTTAQSHYSQNVDSAMDGLQRSTSRASSRGGDVSRSGTLKKRNSISRKASLKRSGSRRSLSAGGIRGVAVDGAADRDDTDYNSAFTTPIPTQGSPTDILAERFQAWRAFLKSLVTYFREVQGSYESRAKAIMKVSNVASNTQIPTVFLTEGGLADANRILTDYHRHAMSEANKAKDIERDVIQALTGLRADLGAKIKEIKNLHGDFKNSVDKERESTKKAIYAYQESLQHYEHSDGRDKGSDPFLVRLSVDRLIEKQIDEENYLHRAYLNLESSGRELESIVVGEIQKAYNALAGIMKRDADDAFNVVDELRAGPIAIQKDLEWVQFVNRDPHLIDPDLPLRRVQDIFYPQKENPAAAEIRAGMLERKSKYLKSYTPGWYVLSPTHIHEFKSADNIYSQPPVMSLYLGDQKLGSHSSPDSHSHKFMLKGRQTGSMHRGHSWVFRAESYDTMMAWFDAIKSLTEKTGAEKTDYVRKHARSVSGNSARAMSIASSDGLEEDEADHIPYSAKVESPQPDLIAAETKAQRPQPGGRFPSDLNVPRDGTTTISDNSSEPDQNTARGDDVLLLSGGPSDRPRTPTQKPAEYHDYEYDSNPYVLPGVASHEATPVQAGRAAPTPQASYQFPADGHGNAAQSVPTQTFVLPLNSHPPTNQVQPRVGHAGGDLVGGAVAGGAVAGAGAGAAAAYLYDGHHDEKHANSAGSAVTPRDPVSRFSASTMAPSVGTTDTEMTDTSVPPTLASSGAAVGQSTAGPIKRQHTDVSVSALHVPGEFPSTSASGTAVNKS